MLLRLGWVENKFISQFTNNTKKRSLKFSRISFKECLVINDYSNGKWPESLPIMYDPNYLTEMGCNKMATVNHNSILSIYGSGHNLSVAHCSVNYFKLALSLSDN